MTSEILYTPEELAAKLKLSKYTIYEMIKRGDIDAHHVGRSIRISESQLAFYLSGSKKTNNTYSGEIIIRDDMKFALIEGIKIAVSTELEGNVRVSIAPEDIILSKNTIVSSARNMLKGDVVYMKETGGGIEVTLDTGIPITSLITRQSAKDMDMKVGDIFYAIFKTMSVKVINAD